MTPTSDREYQYKPPWTTILLCVLFFGACAIGGAFAARSNRGLLIEGIIPLSPQGAAIFWWIMTALSLGFVLFAIRMAVHRVIHTQRIVLTPTEIVVPESRWSFSELPIPYSAITAVWETKNRQQRFLKIAHREGVSTIIATFLPKPTDFDDMRCLLVRRVEASKSSR